jgi:D-erythro-7,8-dihydroneopterin triphosphate epimerase
MAVVKIKKLFLRAFVGYNDHEVGKLQDLIINIEMEYDSHACRFTDSQLDAMDYKSITKEIVTVVENQTFNLIETVAQKILDVIMKEKKVLRATVEVDKVHALRFADSVSVTLSAIHG